MFAGEFQLERDCVAESIKKDPPGWIGIRPGDAFKRKRNKQFRLRFLLNTLNFVSYLEFSLKCKTKKIALHMKKTSYQTDS